MGILCGVDILEIDRIRKSIETIGDSFKERVFTGKEIEYCESKRLARFESYAARFAAKEAVSKALGTGISKGISWKDIEILNNSDGMPCVVLHEKAKEIYDGKMARSISVSLSHCKEYVVAYVIIEA